MHKTDDYDFILPEELIAQEPIYPRDSSRLMVLDRKSNTIEHKNFFNIEDYLVKGDLIVINRTKVISARLIGRKDSGAVIEIFLLKRLSINVWECLVKPGKRLKVGQKAFFGEKNEIAAEICEIKEDGNRIVKFEYDGIFEEILEKIGEVPLPPYIKQKLEKKERYQTVYAEKGESVAAPTAGLHFTEELMERLRIKGVEFAEVYLDVGLGTFRPVSVENILEHKMHSEKYEIPAETAEKVNLAKREGRRVIAVGTTSVRTLESAYNVETGLKSVISNTDIFIYPGYNFKCVDMLITNFHLPKSTLMMLVSAFASRDLIMKGYENAVKEKYRFFSFGDAMLIK